MFQAGGLALGDSILSGDVIEACSESGAAQPLCRLETLTPENLKRSNKRQNLES